MNKHDRKYWCRQKGSSCLTVVSSNFVAAAYQGRVTLTDHPQENHFLVNISELEMSDAGTFQCGVGINGRGLSFRVTLSVAEAPPVPEDAELFYVKLRSTWTVTCSFGKETVEMKKYLCKKEKDGCRNIINSYQDKDVPGGLQLVFEDPPGSFRVTMTQMDWEDAGVYYCGAGDYEKDDPKKELDVFIYEDKNFPHFKTNITGKVGGSASFECLYDPLLNASSRFWCKQKGRQCGTTIIDNTGRVEDSYEGRVTVFQNPENKTLTIILNQLQEKDNGTYWCMSNQLREQQSSTELTVIPGEDAKLSPEFLDVDSSHDSAALPPGGAHSDAEVRKGAAPESSDESQGSNTLALVLGPLAGLILIAVTAFAIVKYRQLKRSDLVSVGSYRTNISMSDFESVRDFSASNSAKETHETSMGGDEFITTTTDTPDSAANTTKAKRSSKEEADLAYSSFLVTSSNIAQASSGGDSAVLDVSPPQDQA
ncbi:hypothetical protein EK904_005098 [Melospiza melodia maxima]|nr:hypothetical protein EK904_005098 [Melospiza melodia maxima]